MVGLACHPSISPEAEIRRSTIQGQAGEYVLGRGLGKPQLNRKKLVTEVCTCHPDMAGGKHKIEELEGRPSRAKSKAPISKITQSKKGWKCDSSGRAPA
jgi:hypothetical protein